MRNLLIYRQLGRFAPRICHIGHKRNVEVWFPLCWAVELYQQWKFPLFLVAKVAADLFNWPYLKSLATRQRCAQLFRQLEINGILPSFVLCPGYYALGSCRWDNTLQIRNRPNFLTSKNIPRLRNILLFKETIRFFSEAAIIVVFKSAEWTFETQIELLICATRSYLHNCQNILERLSRFCSTIIFKGKMCRNSYNGKRPHEQSNAAKSPVIKYELSGKLMNIFPQIFQGFLYVI